MFSADSFPLAAGTTIPGHGVIDGVTLTAYLLTTGEFVPFTRVHERRTITPLVTFG